VETSFPRAELNAISSPPLLRRASLRNDYSSGRFSGMRHEQNGIGTAAISRFPIGESSSRHPRLPRGRSFLPFFLLPPRGLRSYRRWNPPQNLAASLSIRAAYSFGPPDPLKRNPYGAAGVACAPSTFARTGSTAAGGFSAPFMGDFARQSTTEDDTTFLRLGEIN